MPTPAQAFAEVAARHGDVDPTDPVAVRRFYEQTLRTLEPSEILAIIEELLAHEGGAEGACPEPFYPTGVDLPSLRASPSVPLPLLAAGLRRALARFLSSRVKKP